jgi:DNA-binding MarR family transcriptional regulator
MSFQNTVGYLLHQLSHLIDAESDQVLLDRFGIGFAQLKILLVLEETDGITQKQIAKQLRQTEASVSRQIKLLRNKSIIQSKISPANRREHHIYLTSRGMQIADQATTALNNYHAPMFDSLNEKQQTQVVESLQLLRSILTR